MNQGLISSFFIFGSDIILNWIEFFR